LLIIFSPFILLTAVAILIFDGRPLFYLDKRVGRFGRVFYLYKFRSMTDNRITNIGRFLRQARLDELPQLVNVLQGRLSLIGPRPEKPDYVDLYSRQIPYYDIRHLIAPGLSGWAQIYHDGHPHFKPKVEATRDKLSYDLYYVKNRSLWLDLKISLKTLITLMSFSGK
jgi:lipopolysaccharide/colanic/teichoic acid biosynthesis glycosyltransferase